MAKNNPKIDQNDPQAKIIIDWEEFEKLCSLQATEEEIAEWFGCDTLTLRRKIKGKYKVTFEQVFKKKSAKGKISLRRLQFQNASGIKKDGKFLKLPSDTMQIWLGKQHLGQKDRRELSNDPEAPFNFLALVEASQQCNTKEDFDKMHGKDKKETEE